jgi:hypothetical protein
MENGEHRVSFLLGSFDPASGVAAARALKSPNAHPLMTAGSPTGK